MIEHRSECFAIQNRRFYLANRIEKSPQQMKKTQPYCICFIEAVLLRQCKQKKNMAYVVPSPLAVL